MGIRIGVDTGGTFTDFVVFNEENGKIDIFKTPSTPDNPSKAIINGLRHWLDSHADVQAGQIRFFSHGTTVGTNALLTESGATTGLLVTEGFRGIYEVMDMVKDSSQTYDLYFEKPRPLVLPRNTGEVPERLDHEGGIVKALDEEKTRELVRDLAACGVEAVAVCLLFSFKNDRHEKRIRDIFKEEAPAVFVSISSEIAPVIRENYRLSTTVVNAYLGPLTDHYIKDLDSGLDEVGLVAKQRYIMRSNGGIGSFQSTADKSVQTLLSGPAAGVIAGQRIALDAGIANVVTFDIGGTSTDVSLISNGSPTWRTKGKLHDRDIAVPMLDIHTIAAGGGTVAWVDEVGILQLGPRSAGSYPGPACYGRGGKEPTITDANLILGYLDEDSPLAGGSLRLNRRLAEQAIREHVADKLGISLVEAAHGIVEIVNVRMEEAIKLISRNRGHDLRNFYLMAYGGAGPLHAASVAADLNMKGVLLPLYPGVTSAIGLLLSDIRHDYMLSEPALIEEVDADHANELFQSLERKGREDMLREGASIEQIEYIYEADMRYAGQGYELTIAVPEVPLDEAGLRSLRNQFDERHHSISGHSAPDNQVEIVNYRVTIVVKTRKPSSSLPESDRSGKPRKAADRLVYFGHEPTRTPVYHRDKLPIREYMSGPMVINQSDTTVIVPPGRKAVLSEKGFLEIYMDE